MSDLHDDRLDEEQQAAVDSGQKAIAVLAGPGSGKTRALSYRARRLLLDRPGSRVLALTFTNKAAAEMKARALGLTAVASERLRAGTFHGFGVEFLRGHGTECSIEQDFEIIDADEAKEVARVAAAAAGVSDRLSAWQFARMRCLTPNDATVAFGEAYEAAKRSEGVVDFDDLVVYPGTILSNNRELAAAYGARYPHLLVDEFQDTNAAQFRIVTALCPHVETVSVFADDDQAIFRFVGAESENIVRFVDELEAVVYPLTCNYRCRQEIVRRANLLMSADPRPSGRVMRADKSGGSVTLRSFASIEAEAAALAQEIGDRIEDGTSRPADVAVLVRSGYRAREIVEALRRRALPVSDWRGDTYQLAERRIFVTAMSAVRGKLTDRQAARLCDLMSVEVPDERATDKLLEALSPHPVADELLTLRRMAFEGESPSSIARQAQLAVAASQPTAAARLGPLVQAVADFETHDTTFSLDDLLADLVLGAGGRPPTTGGGIKVATLHKTKGLEWPVVYILGLEEGHMPDFQNLDADKLPEERRLCFVGVCRAESELNLTFAARFRTHRRTPSRFLREMHLMDGT